MCLLLVHNEVYTKRGKDMRSQLLIKISILFFAVILMSCGSSNSSNPIDIPPLQLDVQVESSKKVVSVIDERGGTVQGSTGSGQNYLLTLPAGGIGNTLDIGMTPVTSIGALDFVDELIGGVQFEPDGLQFNTPAMLEIALPGSTNYSQLYALAWEGNGTQVALKLFSIDSNNHIKLVVSHFSGVAIVKGDAKAAAQALNTQNSLSIEQRYVAKINQDVQNSMLTADPLDPDAYLDALSKAVDKFALKWLDDINALAQTDLSDADKLHTVFRELDAWNFNILFMTCSNIDCSNQLDAFHQGVNQVRSSMVKGLIGSFEQARDQKNDSEVARLLGEVSLLGDDYEPIFRSLLGLDAEKVLKDELIRLYARQLVIEVRDFPATITVGSDPVTFSIKLSLATSGAPVAHHKVSIGPEFEGCGEISHNGSTPTKDSLDLTTDDQGIIDGLMLAATISCNEPVDQTLFHLRAEDSFQSANGDFGQFFGRDEIYSAINADEQLVILPTGFPASLVQGGASVDFSVRFSLLSNDKPLSNAEVFIGPNNQGCATLNGSRGYDRYITDANGEVTGLTLAAGEDASCTAPIDRSLIYFKVTDAVAAAYTDSDKKLGREVIFEATHKAADFTLTGADWRFLVGVDTYYCDNIRTSCDAHTPENVSLFPQLPPAISESVSLSSTARGGTSANAQASVNFSVQTNTADGQLLTASFNSQIAIDLATGFDANPMPKSSNSATASVTENKGRIIFTIRNRARNYSLSWARTGFAAQSSSSGFAPRKAFFELRGPTSIASNQPGFENGLEMTGVLQPGSYSLNIYCQEGEHHGDIYNISPTAFNFSDSGSCSFNFSIE